MPAVRLAPHFAVRSHATFPMKNRYPVARHLQQLTHQRAQSFALPLLDRTGPLSCDRLLQLTPMKRASFHGFYFNDEVVAKLYFSSGKHADFAQQEIDGLRALQNAGCVTPAFLYAGLTSDQAVSVVLLKWLPNARTVFGLWPELDADDPTRANIVDALAGYLARQHMAGLSLREPHLAQYMWHERQILGIDGGRVANRKKPLTLQQGLIALAQLWAHFAPRWDVLLANGLNAYFAERFGAGRIASASEQKTFWQLLFQFRQQRFAQRLRANRELAAQPRQVSESNADQNHQPLALEPVRSWLRSAEPITDWLAWQYCLQEVELPNWSNAQYGGPYQVLISTGTQPLLAESVEQTLPDLRVWLQQLVKLGVCLRRFEPQQLLMQYGNPHRRLHYAQSQQFQCKEQWASAWRCWQKQLKAAARDTSLPEAWRDAFRLLAIETFQLMPAESQAEQ